MQAAAAADLMSSILFMINTKNNIPSLDTSQCSFSVCYLFLVTDIGMSNIEVFWHEHVTLELTSSSHLYIQQFKIKQSQVIGFSREKRSLLSH